eukprot:4029215-Pleurochrysis_carterae.AAC.8
MDTEVKHQQADGAVVNSRLMIQEQQVVSGYAGSGTFGTSSLYNPGASESGGQKSQPEST